MGKVRLLPLRRNLQILRFWLENVIRRREIHPFYASLKLTSNCHFRCSFCDIWREPQSDLSTGEMKRVLDNLAGSSVLLLAIEGGEPLMRPDIGELLRYIGTLPFYVLFVTSELDLKAYPMAEYARSIDFLHISIDEGHRNLQMFDELEDYKQWGSLVSVQTVVTRRTMPELEWKVRRCHQAGVNMVIMPAVNLDNKGDHYPDPAAFADLVGGLKKNYPGTILTPDGFLRAINRPHGCSSASIIIRSDGELYYPCRIIGDTIGSLVDRDLTELLRGPEAVEARRTMAACDKRCGWYQYFAVRSYTDPREAIQLLKRYV